MPLVKVDAIAEAVALQELFKDDLEAKEEFHQFELAHRESARLQQEELKIINCILVPQKRI